jgi:hypothetical protein
MTMLQVLSEVVCAEKLLGLVAFPKLMHMIQMLRSCFPIRRIGELCTAITANVCHIRTSRGGMKSCMNTGKRGA